MIHLAFLLYLIALGLGISSLTIAAIYFSLYKKRVILSYAGMLVVVALLLTSKMVQLYATLTLFKDPILFEYLALITQKSAYLIALIAGPLFTIRLIGGSLSKRIRGSILVFGMIFMVPSAIEVATHGTKMSESVRLFASMPLLFGTYIACAVYGATRLNTLGSRTLNRFLILFFTLSMIVLPFSVYQYLTQKPFLPNYLEHPIAFIVVTALSMIFGIRYFNKPAYLESNHLSEYFIKSFSITEREQEIVLAVVQGLSNAEIGEKLFISPRTVESHLYKVFQKTEIKNRTQLVNLIVSNRAG